jgi:hypothetical protein
MFNTSICNFMCIKTLPWGALVKKSNRPKITFQRIFARALVGVKEGFYLYMRKVVMTRMKERAKFGVDNPVRGAHVENCSSQSRWAEFAFPLVWIVVQDKSRLKVVVGFGC